MLRTDRVVERSDRVSRRTDQVGEGSDRVSCKTDQVGERTARVPVELIGEPGKQLRYPNHPLKEV